jgi:hypothetical protein
VAVRLVVATLAAALIVFLAVQDHEIGAGAGRYVAAERAALSGHGPAVSVDEMMGPAVRDSVRRGLLWSAVVGAVGLAGTIVLTRRSRRG